MDKSINIPNLLFTCLWSDIISLLLLGPSMASEQPFVSAVHMVTQPDVWWFHYRNREAIGNIISSTASFWSHSHSFWTWAAHLWLAWNRSTDHLLCTYLCRHIWSVSLKEKSSQGFSQAGDGAELNELWFPCSDYRLVVLSETFLPCNTLLRPQGLYGVLDMEID